MKKNSNLKDDGSASGCHPFLLTPTQNDAGLEDEMTRLGEQIAEEVEKIMDAEDVEAMEQQVGDSEYSSAEEDNEKEELDNVDQQSDKDSQKEEQSPKQS